MAEEIIGLKVELDTSGASAPMASLKSQIKEATNELVNFTGKFGSKSKEAINAAKKVAELKDRLGDARQMIDAFNPDAKFNALTQSIQGAVAGFSAVQGAMGLLGVESESTQKALLKVQSAMALSQGLSTFLDSGLEGFRNLGRQIAGPLIDSFKAFSAAARTAIATTGIGLLVIAIGLIAANWDKIKTAMSGISDEQKKLNALAQKNVTAEEDKLKQMKASENIYKLQGKSEREILKDKQDQVRAVIDAKEKQLELLIVTNKAAFDAATNNKRILTSVLDIVQKPLTLLLDGIDLIGKAFGKNFNLKDQLLSFEANLLFDPEQVKKDSDAALTKLKEELLNLKNERAGYELSIKDNDKKSADEASKENKKNSDENARLAKEAYIKELEKLKEKLKDQNDDFVKRRQLVKDNIKLTAEDRKKLNKEIDEDEKKYNEEHQKKLAEINKKYDDEKLDREADTAVKKEELDYKRRLKEIDSLVATTTEKNILIEKLDAEHLVRMATAKKTDDEKALEEKKAYDELNKKYDAEKANREADSAVKKEELDYQRRLAEINSIKATDDEKHALIEKLDAEHKARMIVAAKTDAEKQAQFQKDKDDAIAASKENLTNIISSLEESGLSKTKAGQAISKAIALTQIGIDSAVAISKASTLANAEGVAAQLAFPTIPGAGTIARVISYASTAASVISNIARAKQLLSSGGNAGGSSASAGGTAPNAPSATVFNTTTKLNKDSIDKINDKALKAYVVETDINNGQKRIERILINTKFK
jgi:hypothetical protein